MAEIFEMPQASPTMEVGTLLAWRKHEGDELAPQDVIAEVETDKAAMEIEVFDKGWLLRVLVPEGAEVPPGAPIAIIGTAPDEDIDALLQEADRRAADLAGDSAPAAPAEAATSETRASAPPATGTAATETASDPTAAATAPEPAAGVPPLAWRGRRIDPAIMEAPRHYEAAAASTPAPRQGRLRASPAARRAARERGVDLARVPGTGPRGRVTRKDVAAWRGGAAPSQQAAPASRGDTRVRNSQMRKTIARRLVQVWQDAPVFYLTATLACDRLVDLRAQLKDAGWKLSYNDMLIKAVALALREVPEVNASWGDAAITRHGDVHVGMAVALDDGLITPILRHADVKDLQAIAAETRALAARARDRKLQPDEYQGSTFTVSNLGMMQIDHFTAILNPPEAGILAVGGLQQEPVVDGGALSVAWRMRVTMTCDHRVIDGALGARFLQAVRRNIEAPALLLA